MNNELVSIIIPVYNAEKYLHETLHSILLQTYSNWECIIVDDGSTDSSQKIAKAYCIKDERFKYLYQTNSGPSIARNFGLSKASGDYIQFLDADDVLLAKRFELLLRYYEQAEQNVILYSNVLHGESDNIYHTFAFRRQTTIGHDIKFNDMYERFLKDFSFIPSCLLFPAQALAGAKWDKNLRHSEDWDYYLQVLRNKYIFRYADIPLVIYRNTPNSLSKNTSETLRANYYILSKWSDGNLLTFSKRCALNYKRSILLRLLNKSEFIISPKFNKEKISYKKIIAILMIYPISFYLLFEEIVKLSIKKIRK